MQQRIWLTRVARKGTLNKMTFKEMQNENEGQNTLPLPTNQDTNLVNSRNDLNKSQSLQDLWDGKADYQKDLDLQKEGDSSRTANDPLPLHNLGNTCYMNSMVQSLFVLTFFMDDLTQKYEIVSNENSQSSERSTFEMSKRLIKFYLKYKKLKGEKELKDEIIDRQLNKLKKCVGDKNTQFNSSMQQDTVEFMQLMLSSIEDEFDKVKHIIPLHNNPIRKWFAIEFDSLLKCNNCGHCLNLPKFTTYAMYLCIPDSAKYNSFSLQDAVNNYFKPEKTEHNCEIKECGSNEKMRFMFVSKLPKVLFLQLGRYSEDGTKKHEIVHVPSELLIPEETNTKETTSSIFSLIPWQTHGSRFIRYRLVAAISHYGSTLQGGHYVCDVFQSDTQSWYHCDDDIIIKSSLEMAQESIKNSGYCFFYVKDVFVGELFDN